MVSVRFLEMLLVFIPFIFIVFSRFLKWDVNGTPWNWPILGMIPTAIRHMHRIHDRCAEVLDVNGGSLFFKGIWFSNTDFLLTADPANVHYIMSANFEKYLKGPEFKYIFDILGNGIFNADSDSWKHQRKTAQNLINHKGFLQFMAQSTKRKVERGLVPVLESICKNGTVIDLQDLFLRLAFDSTCMMVTGFDLNSLSLEFPEIPFSKAMDDAQEVIFLRHLFPKIVWELQKKLDFGQAKRMRRAWETIDQIIAELMAIKRERRQPALDSKGEEDVSADLIASFINNEHENFIHDDKFLRDTVLNFMIAGRDAFSSCLSWLFFCLSNKPTIKEKIREELQAIIPANEAQEGRTFCGEEVEKLVYMHGAICETLRLYPPIPFQHKSPVQADTLPSGHHVRPNSKILFSLYALGRMTSVWGADCMEFKPERWITERGTIKHEPSYKFFAFNAGPRTCLGKGVALTQIKIVAAAIIHNYNIEQILGHNVTPSASIMFHMKHGFKVRIRNRWS